MDITLVATGNIMSEDFIATKCPTYHYRRFVSTLHTGSGASTTIPGSSLLAQSKIVLSFLFLHLVSQKMKKQI